MLSSKNIVFFPKNAISASFALLRRNANLLFVAAIPFLLFAYCVSRSCILRYDPRARVSEAKIALSAAYGQQKSYYSEFSHFYEKPSDLAFLQDGNTSYYLIGIPVACAEIAGLKESDAYYFTARGPASLLQDHKEEALAFLRDIDPKYHPCQDPDKGFELYAVGKLDPSLPVDVWKIDQNKNLVHVQVGHRP